MDNRGVDYQLMAHHYRFKSVDDTQFFLFAVFDFFYRTGMDVVKDRFEKLDEHTITKVGFDNDLIDSIEFSFCSKGL